MFELTTVRDDRATEITIKSCLHKKYTVRQKPSNILHLDYSLNAQLVVCDHVYSYSVSISVYGVQSHIKLSSQML